MFESKYLKVHPLMGDSEAVLGLDGLKDGGGEGGDLYNKEKMRQVGYLQLELAAYIIK